MKTETVRFTSTPEEAVELLRASMGPEDVVLVKGSRGMKMERISDPLSPPAASPSEPH
jgi:UDP-N-acetylmuramyl pentapeptide synthase